LLLVKGRAATAIPNTKGKELDRKEILKLEKYFQQRFNLPSMTVRQRPQKADSAEVYIGDVFIGVVFRDDEDGDLSYNFTMAILEMDLE
jgi:hypothetical protein